MQALLTILQMKIHKKLIELLDNEKLLKEKNTLLHYAALNKNKEIYNFLIEQGADNKIKNANRERPNQLLENSQSSTEPDKNSSLQKHTIFKTSKTKSEQDINNNNKQKGSSKSHCIIS